MIGAYVIPLRGKDADFGCGHQRFNTVPGAWLAVPQPFGLVYPVTDQ